MAPNRTLQWPRSKPEELSSNPLTDRERRRRSNLSETQADYERQKKADQEHNRRHLRIFKESDVYIKAESDKAREGLLKAEAQRLDKKRIASGNHHSLLPTEYKRASKPNRICTWASQLAGDDEAENEYVELEREERKKEAEERARETMQRALEMTGRIKDEPVVKTEPEEDEPLPSIPVERWALGNTPGMPRPNY
ncbi:hypothetical protein CAC42_1416 [Sphaceloma murrayae]|uniref:Uncharacterized protein n=1 Tax=Sphaceloma murrayae TaxID=2082308 RepID=A0A2K1QFP4_9PEZI|nr:hypothetical protein CAC42_1416 [Sphaceloma murrayae]